MRRNDNRYVETDSERTPRVAVGTVLWWEGKETHMRTHTRNDLRKASEPERPASQKAMFSPCWVHLRCGGGWTVNDRLKGTARKGKERKRRAGGGGRWGRVDGGRRRREKKKTPELKKQKQNWAHQQRFLISCQNVARSALQLLLSTPPNPPHTSPVPLYTNKPEIILISGREVCWTEKQEVKDLGLRCTIKTHHTHGH